MKSLGATQRSSSPCRDAAHRSLGIIGVVLGSADWVSLPRPGCRSFSPTSLRATCPIRADARVARRRAARRVADRFCPAVAAAAQGHAAAARPAPRRRCRRASRLLVAGLSLAAVAALLYRSVGDPRMLVILLGGIIVIAAALYLVGRGLVAVMGRFRSGVGVAWRYGLANVARRGRASARAGRRVRPRPDRPAAADAGPHRPARGLAADARRERAESLPDQHPAARDASRSPRFSKLPASRSRFVAARARAHDDDQRQFRQGPRLPGRRRQLVRES